ncbi:MATN1-like protein [Mya arenaria]|uniref:MATN1-like protein n=1 Tax=Mya arenaria TaxID=6604 RepID=A0ABY7EUW1_MYAAR|nr:MATN1-like protein [Mya arenaria]
MVRIRDTHKMAPLLPCMAFALAFIHGAMSQGLTCNNPADIMFLLDGSDSIDQREWKLERDFVARMVNSLNISPGTINVGFTVYSSDIDQHVGLRPFKPRLVLNAMAKNLARPTGIATNTARGIAKVREAFRNQSPERANSPKIMIVITDGSSENPAETIRQAGLAKQDGIKIITVGVGKNIFEEELREIATNKQKYYNSPDFAALSGIESQIRNMICKVITTTVRPYTFGPPTPPPTRFPLAENIKCNNPADIIFLIDGSDSISDADFVRLKNFVVRLIENFEITNDAIHVGMIVYSTLIGNKVPLFPFKNKFVLKMLTKNLEHPKFGTDTAAGVAAARDMLRTQGRPDAPEMIVVITDGRSASPRNTIIQAGIAKAQGITMISIGVGKDIFSEELRQIASGPNYVSEVADFKGLENIVNVLRNLICTSITTPATTTTTMLPPTPPPSIPPPADGLICNVPGDVMFVLDGSNSIKPNDWIRQRNFVANLISHLEVGPEYIHVSVVVYSTTIGDVIPLIPFRSKFMLKRNVAQLTQPRFGTDTALGIQRAREILKGQGRADAPSIVIVVTDGKSTYPKNTAMQSLMAKADGRMFVDDGVMIYYFRLM